MLLMPTTDVNFQALAENITSEFFSKGTPLADGIVKVAKENSFTPEEVERLVEKTNTAASLHLLKTADDKKGTFTLANKILVLQQTHPSEDTGEVKTASLYTGIPKTKNKKPICKTAALVEQSKTQEKSIDGLQALFTVRKALDEYKLKKVATELNVQDKIDYLASEFSIYRGPNFKKFANDCTHLFGVKARPVLEGLAKYLRVPLAKTAEDVDYIDDRTDHIKAMREICDGLQSLVKTGEAIRNLNKIHNYLITGLNQVYG